MLHFTSLGKFCHGAAEAGLEWFAACQLPDADRPLLNVLLGMTPVTNKSVVRLMKHFHFQTMEIPDLCYLEYPEPKLVPGVIGALNLR
jgi:hypothetical protein